MATESERVDWAALLYSLVTLAWFPLVWEVTGFRTEMNNCHSYQKKVIPIKQPTPSAAASVFLTTQSPGILAFISIPFLLLPSSCHITRDHSLAKGRPFHRTTRVSDAIFSTSISLLCTSCITPKSLPLYPHLGAPRPPFPAQFPYGESACWRAALCTSTRKVACYLLFPYTGLFIVLSTTPNTRPSILPYLPPPLVHGASRPLVATSPSPPTALATSLSQHTTQFPSSSPPLDSYIICGLLSAIFPSRPS